MRAAAPVLAFAAVLTFAGCSSAPVASSAAGAPPVPVQTTAAAVPTSAAPATDPNTGYLIKTWGQEASQTSSSPSGGDTTTIVRFTIAKPVIGPRCSPYTERPATGTVYRDIPITATTAPASTAGVEDLITVDLVGAWALRGPDGTSTTLPLVTCHTDIAAVPYGGLQPGRTYKFVVTVATPANVAGYQLELQARGFTGGWAWNL